MDAKNQLIRYTHCESPLETMANTLADDAKEQHWIGASCNLILAPQQYQLVVMDALDVPEADRAKALKWHLKGLIEYPLNDIALDVFMAPSNNHSKQQKVFVAVTPLSKLRTKLALFESACIDINEVGIAELALRQICTFLPNPQGAPMMVLSLEKEHCQLHVFYHHQLYLVRTLKKVEPIAKEGSSEMENMLLEIQRSIDYCLVTLRIPEPQRIVFTPGFYKTKSVLDYLKKEQKKPIDVIDLNSLLALNTPLTPELQHHLFYSIGGALQGSESTTLPHSSNEASRI